MCGCGLDRYCAGGCDCGCDHASKKGQKRQAKHFALQYKSAREDAKHPAGPSQRDVYLWVDRRWPTNTSPLDRAAKLCEEAGETIGAVIKWQTPGDGRKTVDDIAQETAQVVICALGLAESVGFNLRWEVNAEWKRVQGKTSHGPRKTEEEMAEAIPDDEFDPTPDESGAIGDYARLNAPHPDRA